MCLILFSTKTFAYVFYGSLVSSLCSTPVPLVFVFLVFEVLYHNTTPSSCSTMLYFLSLARFHPFSFPLPPSHRNPHITTTLVVTFSGCDNSLSLPPFFVLLIQSLSCKGPCSVQRDTIDGNYPWVGVLSLLSLPSQILL
uniref:Uncharacterized protein n=1 Tax=Spongospora subterranea TaxID=70186 RepID=A0A0H5QG15_9EUKA|eukprot:CRZ00522.1 hypothetical protein [Spongospora subterranea]